MNFSVVGTALALISLISLLDLSIYVRAQQLQADGRYYSSRYDNLDVDTLFQSSRLLSNYIDCLLEKKPCPPEGKELKRVLPGALKTSCDQCTAIQRKNVLEIIKRLYFQYPDKYIALAEKYDPTGKYTKRFEEWFERNSNFINESEVTISNLLTTRRQPPATRPPTTTSPRPTFSLLTTTRRATQPTTSTTTTTVAPRTSPSTRRSPPLLSSQSSSSQVSTATRVNTRRQTTTTTASTTLSPLSLFVTSRLPLFATTNTIRTIAFALRPRTQTSKLFFTATTNFPTTQTTIPLMTTSRATTTTQSTSTTQSPPTSTTPTPTQKTQPSPSPAFAPAPVQFPQFLPPAPLIGVNPANDAADRTVQKLNFVPKSTTALPTRRPDAPTTAKTLTFFTGTSRRPTLITTPTRVPIRTFPSPTSAATTQRWSEEPSFYDEENRRVASGNFRPPNRQEAPPSADIIDMFFVPSG